MPVLWQGHEVDAYKISSGFNNESEGAIDAAYERSGMRAGRNGSGDLYSIPDFAAQDDIWHRFNHVTNINAGMVVWGAVNAGGIRVAQIVASDLTHWQYQVSGDGAVWANVGAAFSSAPSNGAAKTRFDVHHRGTVGGRVEIYYGAPGAQVKVVDVAADFSDYGGIVRIYHGCNSVGGGFDTDVAHEVVQTTPTLATTSECKPPIAQGDADGTGDYTTVDEETYSDADFIVLSAVGQHQSFTSAARTQTQSVVSGITVSCRAWYEAGGPTSIKPYLKIAGVRYYGPTFALDLLPLGYQHTFLTHPATGLAFTTAEANDAALGWGWEAVA